MNEAQNQTTQCKREGEFAAKVANVAVIQHRFKQGFYEIRLDFATSDNSTGKIYLDLSNDYVQGGNNAGKLQFAVTAETLNHFGVDVQSLAQVKNLIGREISVFGKLNGKGYLNFYLNTSRPEIEANLDEASTAVAALFGQTAQTAQNGNMFENAPSTGGAVAPDPFANQR